MWVAREGAMKDLSLNVCLDSLGAWTTVIPLCTWRKTTLQKKMVPSTSLERCATVEHILLVIQVLTCISLSLSILLSLSSPPLPSLLLLPGYSWGSWEGNDWQNQWSKTTLLSKLFHFFLFTFPFCISFFDSSPSFILPANLPLPLSCWDQIILHGALSWRQEGDRICKPLI